MDYTRAYLRELPLRWERAGRIERTLNPMDPFSASP